MEYLHTMVRVRDLDAALDFFVNKLGLVETRRKEVPKGRFTLVFLATEPGAPELELECPIAAELLHPMVFPVGHIDITLGVDRDPPWRIELARA